MVGETNLSSPRLVRTSLSRTTQNPLLYPVEMTMAATAPRTWKWVSWDRKRLGAVPMACPTEIAVQAALQVTPRFPPGFAALSLSRC